MRCGEYFFARAYRVYACCSPVRGAHRGAQPLQRGLDGRKAGLDRFRVPYREEIKSIVGMIDYQVEELDSVTLKALAASRMDSRHDHLNALMD